MSELENEDWKTTDNRFVAFIDILGFKDMVMRNSHSNIYEKLLKISKQRETISIVSNSDKYKVENINSGIYTVSFSDSIVIFSKNDTETNFKSFTTAVLWLFANSIKGNIPMKGSIAHGEISINRSEQIYFGQPIIDAYLLQEEVNYMGIVAHNTIDKYIKDNLQKNELIKFYSEFKTPLKCGNINHLNLNWFLYILYDKKEEKLRPNQVALDILNEFKANVSGSPRKYIDNTINVLNELYKKNK